MITNAELHEQHMTQQKFSTIGGAWAPCLASLWTARTAAVDACVSGSGIVHGELDLEAGPTIVDGGCEGAGGIGDEHLVGARPALSSATSASFGCLRVKAQRLAASPARRAGG